MIRILLILFAALYSTTALSETTTRTEKPEVMVAGYLASMNAYDFNRAVEYFAESDCVQFKRMLVPLLQTELAAGKSDLSKLLLGRAMDLQQVSAMHPCEFVANSISSLTSYSNAANMPMSNPNSKIIGGVKESDALVHYVVRSTAMLGETPVSSMEIVSARRETDGWHVQMSEKMKGMSAVITRALQQHASGADKTAKADVSGKTRP